MIAGVGVTVCVGMIAALWAGPLRSAAGTKAGRGSGADVARTGEPRATAVLGAVAERPADAEAEAGALPAVADAPIIQAPATFEGRRAVARPARPLAAATPMRPGGEGGTWALVVGINDYPGDSHDLLFAVNDADDLDAALSRNGIGANRRLVLRDGQATSEAIRAGLAWLVERAGEDSLAVVSFAGHAREQGDRHAFVAADGVELADRELAGRLGPLRSGKVWLNFGTCYGGGFNELLAPGRLLTGAAPAGQLAYESTAIGRSYLGEYMVRRGLLASGGVDGDVGRAFVAGRDAVARDHPDRVPVAIAGPGSVEINLRSASTPRSQSAASSEPAGAAGSGSSPPSSDPPPPSQPAPAEEPAPRRDECADLTLGTLRCG